MRTLDLADLVTIAGRALELDSDTALELLDLEAADAALAAAREVAAAPDARPEHVAAVLLVELVRRGPLTRDNGPVALLAATQVLGLNGRRVELEPETTAELLTQVAAGLMGPAEVCRWFTARLLPAEPAGGWEGAIVRAARELRRRRGGSRLRRYQESTGWRPQFESTAPGGEGAGWVPGAGRGGGLQDRLVRFTSPARRVVVTAQAEARQLNHNYIGTEHLLLGLLAQPEELAARTLERLHVSAGAVRAEIERIVGRGPATADERPVPFAPRVKKVLELATREALRRGQPAVRCEHLLMALLAEGNGLAAKILVTLVGSHGLARVEHTLTTLEAEEVTHLRAEVARLRALLQQHGIPIPDPPEDGTATAS
jgi:Clp amino terminal domain, pathogenicity island component